MDPIVMTRIDLDHLAVQEELTFIDAAETKTSDKHSVKALKVGQLIFLQLTLWHPPVSSDRQNQVMFLTWPSSASAPWALPGQPL